MTKFSIGTDSEVMIHDAKGNLKSAIGIVHGDKINRLDLGNGHFAFHDNVLAECNMDPANNKDEFLSHLKDCYERYANVVKPNKLVIQASAMYPESELNCKEAWEVGCTPSYDAYEVCMREPGAFVEGNRLRTGGGHVHLGGKLFTSRDEYFKIWVVRMLDLFLSVPAIYIDWDKTSTVRRELYGAPGDHRPKEYGVEYRSISNFWLISPAYASLVYDICDFALDICVNEQHEDIFKLYCGKNEMAEDLVKCINTGNKTKSKKYMDICKKLMPKKLWDDVNALIGKEPGDFYKNWGFKIK